MRIYDIAIVGRGITGLSAVGHLLARGFENLALIGPEACLEQTASMGAHFALIATNDNITRAAHNHGTSVAKALLSLNFRGFREALRIIDEHNVPSFRGRSLRVAESAHEKTEMDQAVSWLIGNGFPARVERLGSRWLQVDGAASVVFSPADLLRAMSGFSRSGPDIFHGRVESIAPSKDYIELRMGSGKPIRAQMIVLACHTGIKKLLPVTEPTLVNHADQVMELKSKKKISRFSPGDVIFCGHSQFWFAVRDCHTVIAGGARYLRKWAGVEAMEAQVLPEVSRQVTSKCEELFGLRHLTLTRSSGQMDLRACDEIPVIGPMFGDSRILIGSGYMGTGVTMGLAAGEGLAEFVATGKSSVINPMFYPARLRSLPDAAT